MTVTIFITLVAWNVIGFWILHCYEDSSIAFINESRGRLLPYLNPIWLYKNYKVNVIGLLFLTLLFNFICPVISVFYWVVVFIKWMCIVGRK